jgi:hypothetical protein
VTALILAIFFLFVAALSLVVLRFSAVISQMLKQQSVDKRELLRDIDLSHQRAHENAMDALRRIHERTHQDQLDMLNRTMDMIHGPQQAYEQPGDMAVDSPKMDIRPAWMPDDDAEDGGLIYSDPTDEYMPDPPGTGPNPEADRIGPDDSMGYARSIRPGESLIQ